MPESSALHDASTQQTVNQLIQQAVEKRASDIHIEPLRSYCRIRFRIDSLLHEIATLPHWQGLRIVTHLKFAAELNIAEKRLPQDGRLRYPLANHRDLSIRLSTCPHHLGEKMVLRLFQMHEPTLSLNHLGLLRSQYERVHQAIHQPHGLILITGPTGCGKTTTLYAALSSLNTTHKNIISIEDPVEMELNGITQVNVHPRLGLSFSAALRSFLRQDPDIIFIGEIRDQETAEIALQAAQTGHLVFASLHTLNTQSTLTRLQRLGTPSHLLKESLTLIVSQRLVRKPCLLCHASSPSCNHCHEGYHGQTALFECWQPPLESQSPLSLYEAGTQKCALGETTPFELNRVLGNSHAFSSIKNNA